MIKLVLKISNLGLGGVERAANFFDNGLNGKFINKSAEEAVVGFEVSYDDYE